MPLDLAITLTPPGDAYSEALASIAVNCTMLGLSHSGDLLKDPLTQKERDDLRWYLEEYGLWPFYEFAERGKRIEALLVEVGKRLLKSVVAATMPAPCRAEVPWRVLELARPRRCDAIGRPPPRVPGAALPVDDGATLTGPPTPPPALDGHR